MNTQEFLNMLKIFGATMFGMLAMHGYMTPEQASTIMGDLTVAVPALLSAGTMAWSLYAHWNMKKVPENSVAIEPHAIVGAPVVGTTVGLPTTAKVVGALLMAMTLSMLAFPHGSSAQTRLPRINLDPLGLNKSVEASESRTMDNVAAQLAKPFQDIAAFIGDDADGAVSLATIIPALQDGHGQQCWMAMKSFGDIIKAHPVPITFRVITDYETLRLLGIATNNLCSNVHCTQVFADATAMAQAASPIQLAIPSLHDLCTKVPQIAVVAPVTPAVSAAPPAAPAPAK